MTPLISIIIPTYNSGKYFKECLDSVVKQTYKNLEVIIVDGGSTDNTKEIANNYCDKYDTWHLITTGKGVAHQRNVGLKAFKGDFVYFLDSDDYISSNLIEDLYIKLVNHDLDMVVPSIHNIFLKDREIIKTVIYEPRIIHKVNKSNFFSEAYDSYVASPTKLFKRQLVDNLEHDETLSNGEDLLFNYQMVIKEKELKYDICESAIYYYRHDISTKNPAIKRMNKSGYGFCNKMLPILKGMDQKDKNYYGALEILDIQLSLFLKQYASSFKIMPPSLLGPRLYVFKNTKKKKGRLFYIFPRLYLFNRKTRAFLSKAKRKLKQIL